MGTERSERIRMRALLDEVTNRLDPGERQRLVILAGIDAMQCEETFDRFTHASMRRIDIRFAQVDERETQMVAVSKTRSANPASLEIVTKGGVIW